MKRTDKKLLANIDTQHDKSEIDQGSAALNIKKRHYSMVLDAIEIEKEDAISAGHLGFIHKGLTLCTMPYKDIKGGNEYTRSNGNVTLTIISPKAIGIPYGSIPRLLYIYISTEAVKTKQREILLGRSLGEFMENLGLHKSSGGKRGDITRLYNQIKRLFASRIQISYEHKNIFALRNIDIAEGLSLWHPKDHRQLSLWGNHITLNESFFKEITEAPVPLDLRAVKAFKSAPLELDLYFWLSHRLYSLKRPTIIPYPLLKLQFGAQYKRDRAFKENFLKALKNVQYVWQSLKITADKDGLRIHPSKLPIDRHSMAKY